MLIMNKKIAILSLLIISAGLSSTALAYMGKQGPNTESINFDEAIHEQLTNAIENRDYNEWIKIRTENNLPMKGRIFQMINEDNFDTFAKMHEARLAGNVELVNQYRTELGLETGRMSRQHCNIN